MNRLVVLFTFAFLLLIPVSVLAEKEWTVLVYMAADNDLEPFGVLDMNEMEVAGSSNEVNIVVQFDRAIGHDYSNGDWTTTRRYYITQDSDVNKINSQMIADLGELNMGDPQTLQDFIQWGRSNYPAEKYFLILWDHGSGWHKKKNNIAGLDSMSITMEIGVLKDTNQLEQIPDYHIQPDLIPSFNNSVSAIKSVATDYSHGDDLKSEELQTVLEDFPSFDIIGFDACVMGMIEVAYEIKDHAEYMIASQENEPGIGWSYDCILLNLVSNPTITPPQLCSLVVNCYQITMDDTLGFTQTLSAIDLSLINAVNNQLSIFCNELITNGVWSEMNYYFPNAESFGSPYPYYDIYHIADLSYNYLSGQSIKNAALNLISILNQAVLLYWTEMDHPNAYGLSIYFPQYAGAYEALYHASDLDFAEEAAWLSFLQYYWGGGSQMYDLPEPNNVFTQAGMPLNPNYNYSSYISSVTDVDCWLINSGISETVTINLDVPPNADFDMYVYNNTGSSILALSENNGNGVDEFISYNSSLSEYFYLKIVPYYSMSNQPYQITLNQQGHDKGEFNLAFDDGSPVTGWYSENYGDVLGVYYELPTYPMKVERVWINFASLDATGLGGNGSFYMLFSDNYGDVIDPLELGRLYPAGVGWNYLDLSDDSVLIYTPFFLGVYYDGFNTPAIAGDDYARGKDWYYNSTTQEWSPLGSALFFRLDVSFLEPQVSYICGDANGDGSTDVSDAVYIINYAFVGGTPPDPLMSGEANCDGSVDVSDAVYIINYAFVGGNPPCDTDGDGIPDC